MNKKKRFCTAVMLLLTAAMISACEPRQTEAETGISGTAYDETANTKGQPVGTEKKESESAQPKENQTESSEENPNSRPETVLSESVSTEADPSGTNDANESGTENDGQMNETVSRAVPSVTGSLRVEGTQLTGQNGEAVQLRGISTHGLAWFPEYVNEACFQELREDWQINVIRLALYTAEYGGYCSGGDQEALKAKIREGVEYAREADLYVIIDWHILSDCSPQTYREEAKAFFDEMASLYAGSDHVLYEICNEPNGSTDWGEIKSYAEEIIGVIRAHDENAVILIGTPNWSQYVDQAAADPITKYDNLMYTLHFYAATHKEELRKRMTDALEAGLPVFVSEYGICDASGSGAPDEAQANLWIARMNEYGVSYVAWNLSNKNETSAILSDSCKKTSGFVQEDLSASGLWLYKMLTGTQPASEEVTENFEPAETQSPAETQPPAEMQPPAETQPPAESPAGQQDQAAVTLTGEDLELTPVLVNSWESDGRSFYHYTMTLRNVSGKTGSAWAVELEFSGEISLEDGWNGDYTVQGRTLLITSKDYNGAVAADGSVSDVGFIVSGGSL